VDAIDQTNDTAAELMRATLSSAADAQNCFRHYLYVLMSSRCSIAITFVRDNEILTESLC